MAHAIRLVLIKDLTGYSTDIKLSKSCRVTAVKSLGPTQANMSSRIVNRPYPWTHVANHTVNELRTVFVERFSDII